MIIQAVDLAKVHGKLLFMHEKKINKLRLR